MLKYLQKIKHWWEFDKRADSFVRDFLVYKGCDNLEWTPNVMFNTCDCLKHKRQKDGEYIVRSTQRETILPLYYNYVVEFEGKILNIDATTKCVCGKRYYRWSK